MDSYSGEQDDGAHAPEAYTGGDEHSHARAQQDDAHARVMDNTDSDTVYQSYEDDMDVGKNQVDKDDADDKNNQRSNPFAWTITSANTPARNFRSGSRRPRGQMRVWTHAARRAQTPHSRVPVADEEEGGRAGGGGVMMSTIYTMIFRVRATEWTGGPSAIGAPGQVTRRC